MAVSIPSITGLPPSCRYLANFLTPGEEQQVIREVQRLPAAKWTRLRRRRLVALPSSLTGSARDTLIAAPLPSFLDPVVARLSEYRVFGPSTHRCPNHILINEYQPGEGIMPHEDGPAYYPTTATVSLGSHTVLEIYEKTEHRERKASPSWRILQEPRSLLVTTDDMYVQTLHGISELESDGDLDDDHIVNWPLLGNRDDYVLGKADRQMRISLTLRDVVKVAKVGAALKFMAKP